jgi:hypothetical protein
MIAALTAASPEELASIRALLALPKAAKAPKAAPKVPKTKVEKVALPLPEGCPTASDYRLDASEINHSLCVGRDLSGGEDKRFKPTIYRESQCGKPAADGDLCKTCAKRCAKYEESGKQGPWNGRVTEEPLDGCHMLGTAWAETKKPVFGAGSAAASAETSDAEEAKAEPKEPKVKPAKPAKEPKVKAEKPAKEPKEPKEPKVKAEKPAKEPKVKAEKPQEPKEPKAKTAPKAKAKVAKPVEVTSELVCLDGTVYMVKNGNVFEYDELAEAAGEYQGRLRADKTIDTEAEQVESDSE